MTYRTNLTAFHLSRIYAQGWNAGRGLDTAQQINPYPTEPARGRWQEGFANAQASSARKIR